MEAEYLSLKTRPYKKSRVISRWINYHLWVISELSDPPERLRALGTLTKNGRYLIVPPVGSLQ
jgi:hypothetical protein